MPPTDKWLGLFNFYLIMASAGELTRSDFSEEELAAAYASSPGLKLVEMSPLAEKLVLEFQSRKEDSGSSVSPIGDEVARLPLLDEGRGQTEESPHGALPLPVS